MSQSVYPWMRFHVARWRMSRTVMSMNLAEQGAYANLLFSAWQQGGKLPNDPAVLWKYANAQTPEEFDAVKAKPLSKFEVDGDYLINGELVLELEESAAKQKEISEKRSRAGRKGNQVKWADHKKARPQVKHDAVIDTYNRTQSILASQSRGVK